MGSAVLPSEKLKRKVTHDSDPSFICFDTEDDSKERKGQDRFNKQVTQIAARSEHGDEFYSRGPDTKRFKKWLLDRPEKYIYAHNIQYDLGNLFAEELDSLDSTLVGGRMVRSRWKNKEFRDTFNIWPMSVKKLAPAFGLAKLDMDVRSEEYVFQDVEIIRQAMNYVWQVSRAMGIETPPGTLGGLCVKVWRNWGGENIPCTDALVRQALYGGRVELFKVCNESKVVAYTDINSLYPYVMTRKFPEYMYELETTAEPEYGVMDCTVQVPESEITVLPFRGADGMMLYPWGTFRGVWTVHELRAAERRGARILRVHEVMGSNDTVTPYAEFVNRLYRMRLDSGSEAERLFFKLLMNNLYGRLGATGRIGRTVALTDEARERGVAFGTKCLIDYQMPPGEEVNWAHAAYVTSYGRLELLDYLEAIGPKAMIYCDTDSAIFDCPKRRLPFSIGKGLGQMKLEAWEKSCEPHAPKTYSLGSNYKAKGVPKRLAREFFFTGKASFDLPFKFKEAIAFFDRGNAKKLSVWREVHRTKISDYDRKVLQGGRYLPKKISAP